MITFGVFAVGASTTPTPDEVVEMKKKAARVTAESNAIYSKGLAKKVG